MWAGIARIPGHRGCVDSSKLPESYALFRAHPFVPGPHRLYLGQGVPEVSGYRNDQPCLPRDRVRRAKLSTAFEPTFSTRRSN